MSSKQPQRRRGSTSPASAARDQNARQAPPPTTPTSPSGRGAQRPSSADARAAQRDQSRRAQRVIAAHQAKRRRQFSIIGGAVGLAVVVVLVLIYFNRDDSGGTASEPVTVPASVGANADLIKDGRTLGSADAPVTVIEWGDYQCPACGNFNRTTKQRLIDEYVSTGQVKFEYRDLPFLDNNASGSESDDSAAAAYCAGEQDRFWDFHDTLFNNQIGENNGAFAKKRLTEMATQLDLDVDAFESCMDSDAAQDAVQAMADEAETQQVRSTPTFIINGTVVVGGNYTDIAAAINTALGQ